MPTSGTFPRMGYNYNRIFFEQTGGSGVLQPTTLTDVWTWTLPNVTGTIITTGNLSSITAVGGLTSGSIPTYLLTGTLSVANGGTGQTTFTNGQILIGNTTGNTLTKATLTAGSGITITNGNGSITIAAAGGSGTVTSVAATVPAFLTVTGSPITSSGTLAISLSGTALPVANGGTGITAFGTGIATFLGTPTSANLAAALTNETGTGSAVFGTTPTFTNSIIVNQSGQSELAGMEVVTDPLNGTVRALYILPPQNGSRIYFGKTGQGSVTLNFGQVSGVENFPSLVATSAWTFINYAAGDDAFLYRSFNGGMRVECVAGSSFQVRNSTTSQSLRVFNTWISATNWEAGLIDWQTTSNTLRIGSDVGSGGGTARNVQLVRGGVVKETVGANTTDHTQPVKLPSYIVSGLPSASTCGAGSMAFVTDATSSTVYTTVIGGGSNKVLVISDGANWIIH